MIDASQSDVFEERYGTQVSPYRKYPLRSVQEYRMRSRL